MKARKIVMVASALLMLSGIPAFLVQSNSVALAWISVVLMGYTSWASNILSLPADLFPSEEVAQVTGLSGTAAGFGGMLFTLATGWLVVHISYGSVFVASCVIILCAVTIIIMLVPTARMARPRTV